MRGRQNEMQREMNKSRSRLRERLTYANVMSTIAVFLAVGGATAFATVELGKNTIGSRQLKASSVTTGKIATNAVNGSKVANQSLTGSDINVQSLGTVPAAASASHADEASAIGGHAAGCPAATILFHGVCFDAVANPPAKSVEEAAEACSAKGGFLPSPLELFNAREVLSLGTGIGSDHQYTDEIYTDGGEYKTVVVDGNGAITKSELNVPSRYICVYTLLH